MCIRDRENIDLNFSTSTKEETLNNIAQMAFDLGRVTDKETFFEALCDREKESTTGFGNGIAIPHARHNCVKNAGIIFIRCKKEIEWDSLDGEPVKVCLCLLAPDDKNDLHLKMLSKLARKLMYDDFIEILKYSPKEDVVKIINEIIL